jgi:hypothetical protein
VITDFNQDQDVIDLSVIFVQSDYGRSQPFNTYVKLTQSAADTVVRVDSDGDTTGGFVRLAKLEGVTASNLSASNFVIWLRANSARNLLFYIFCFCNPSPIY